MEGEEEEEEEVRSTTRREMEAKLLQMVSNTIFAINTAKRVDDVVVALCSLAVHLFPVDSQPLSGVVSEPYKHQLSKADVPQEDERQYNWQLFYQGAAFPTLARILLYDVASNWLPCFPLSAQKIVYDAFFLHGLTSEVVQTVVPCLDHRGNDGYDVKAVTANAERLLELCMIQKAGVLEIAHEFRAYREADFQSTILRPTLSRVAQLVASIPDKARFGAPKSLSSHFFFKQMVIQLLAAVEGKKVEECDSSAASHMHEVDGTFMFIGELFARICRRGSADMLVSELVPRILGSVQNRLLQNKEHVSKDVFLSEMNFRLWSLLIEQIRDPYAIERLTEQILHQLASERASDVSAYWVLWLMFHCSYEEHPSIRFLFLEKFLLWKVFPLCCLRWILQFSVLGCPPDISMPTKGDKRSSLLDALQSLATVWSKREFVQSAPAEQQTYITAAVGLLLEKMSREELDSTKDIMHSILEGVSCRLENPSDLVRKMASSIALAFSKVIDPNNPLYLDDTCTDENIDWEFGLVVSKKGTLSSLVETSRDEENGEQLITSVKAKQLDDKAAAGVGIKGKSRNKMPIQYKLVDPDEVIDPATLSGATASLSDDEHDENASENSESSSDSSLEPYDLTDDDSDLKRNFTQLVDVVGALRKSDDPDSVERALATAERLVRASPDELRYVAGDLVRTLVQVRCSDTAVEGNEESDEEKRQRALVALLVTCPFESLESINKLIYSPHLDVSQRIMILDVMTDAAEELANTRTVKQKCLSRPLISSTRETQPWFMPSGRGAAGAGPWKEISDDQTPLNWSYRYERELPSRSGHIQKGKTRRWSLRPPDMQGNETELSLNEFPRYVAAFMLPAMQGYDKKSHGVDLLGRDFIVLGKLIHMLGTCMKCAALHPEASVLAPHLLDMLSSRQVCHHKEAYVRRSVLYAASCILMAVHPSYVATALIEGNQAFARGLEWIRTWALHVAESDTDKDCYAMAMGCLQLHAKMALQASRALESAGSAWQRKSIEIPSNSCLGTIKIPGLSLK